MHTHNVLKLHNVRYIQLLAHVVVVTLKWYCNPKKIIFHLSALNYNAHTQVSLLHSAVKIFQSSTFKEYLFYVSCAYRVLSWHCRALVKLQHNSLHFSNENLFSFGDNLF